MTVWKGMRRFYNEEDNGWSNRIFPSNWLPLIAENIEEGEDGRRKQTYILLDDIPSKYRDDFLSYYAEELQQIVKEVRKDNEVITSETIKYCVKRRIWDMWFRQQG